MHKKISFRLASIAAIASIAGVVSLTAPAAAYAEHAAETPVVLPFSFVSMNAKYHIIAWFEGHPEFEAVEAFVYGENRIRAILTRHDGSQIDVFSGTPDQSPVTAGREWYEGKCSFQLAKNGRDAELSVAMSGGNELTLCYFGQGKPDPKHGGLTDPGTHSPEGGLPAFFREASGVSGKKSYVRIGSASYAIPVDRDISKPPFFTGYRAYLSEGYASMIIPTTREMTIPALQTVGADGKETTRLVYNTDTTDNEVTVSMNGAIAEVSAVSSSSPAISGPGYHNAIHFTPPFPNLYALKDGEPVSCHFAITFGDGKKEEICGTVLTEKKGDTVTVRLLPDFPLWAKKSRAIRYTVRLNDTGATVSSVMLFRAPGCH
jgi:hypothetical protein